MQKHRTEIRFRKKRGNTLFIPYGWRIHFFAGSGDYFAMIRTVYF